MNFKISLLILLITIFGCGVKGRPRPKDGTEKFKPFNKIYQKDIEEEETKKDKKSK